MDKIVALPSSIIPANNTIFYNIVGNFIPPEWHALSSKEGKVLSKSARQLLSLFNPCIESLLHAI